MNKQEKKMDLLQKLSIIREVKYPKLKDVAAACGKTSPAVTGWLKSGNIDYMEHSENIAKSVGLTINDLHSMSLLAFRDYLYTLKNPNTVREPIKAYSIKPVLDESDLNNDEVMVNVYNVSLSAGNGSAVPEYVETTHQRAFSLDWMARKGLKHKNLKLMKVSGTSMEPVLNDGDMVLFDTSQTNIIDGKVYALVVGTDAKIKRLKKTFDGGIVIMSYNPHDDFKDVVIGPEDMQYIHIIGLAVHKSGDI